MNQYTNCKHKLMRMASFVLVVIMLFSCLIPANAFSVNEADAPEFHFYIGNRAFTAKEGWTWADWILSYGISAGDNGIVWIGYANHPYMEHGYLYYGDRGTPLGECQIVLEHKKVRYDDVIQPIVYGIDFMGVSHALNETINVLNPSELTTGYVAPNGTFDTTATLSYTKRIPVTRGDTFAMWHFGAGATNTGFRFVTAYDENGKVLPSAGSDSTQRYTVPAGVASVVFTISNGTIEQSMILKNCLDTPDRYVAFNDSTQTLEIPKGEHLINLFNAEAVSEGYMAPTGGVSSASTLCYTEKLSVKAGDVLFVWKGTAQYTPRFITAFDENGKAVADCGSSSPAAVYTVPEGITGVVFTIYTSAKDTVMIFKNDDTVPPVYIPYNKEVPDEEEDNASDSVQYGPEYLTAFGNMGADTTLCAGRADIITDKHLTFMAEVASFEGLRIGHGYQDYTANYIEIDNTTIRQYFYTSSPALYKEVAHGMEIKNDVKVTIDVNTRRVATITLESNGQTFTFSTSTNWYGSNGDIYATSLGSELPNAKLLFTCDGYADDIHFYGDSYLSQSSDRWLYFAFKDGYTNALFDGYGGRGSAGAYASLVENLKHSDPKIVVWMMGMNDGSDPDLNTPSKTWETYRDKLIELSEQEGFELVFATIPTVPKINHEAKNKWIRESGYRYIDMAAAVGADGTGAWAEDMLSTDNVHPSASGSAAIYQQVKKDLAEFKPEKET